MKRHFPSLTPFRSIVGLVLVAVLATVFLATADKSDAQLADVSGRSNHIDTSKLPSSIRQRIEADRESGSVPVDVDSLPKARPDGGTIVYAYNALSDRLVSFAASAPGTLLTDVEITGVSFDDFEFVAGIDFRPSDGTLFGLYSRGFPRQDSVVRINTVTGEATPVHPTNNLAPLADSFHGFSFHPSSDTIRNVGRERSNRRLSPATGTILGIDSALAYAAGDPNVGVVPRIVHTAYADTPSSVSSTLFGIDSEANTLVRIGGINGAPSPNGGQLTTIGPLGFDFTNFGGMDIPPGSGFAYAALNINSIPHFVQIDLATGAGAIIGEIGSGDSVIDGLAIPPGPFVLPSPSPTQTPVPSPTPTATLTPTPTATPTPTPISIIRAENAAGLPGEIATVPIDLISLGNESSLSFSVNFDPTKLQLRNIGLGNGAPLGAILTSDVSQAALGRLGITITSGVPYSAGPRRLALIVFDIMPGALYISTPITFGGVPTKQNVADLTGASLPVAFQAGRVIVGFTAAGVDVSGRVLTADGRGLRNARVVMTDAGGSRRVVTTSSFGHYRFTDVEAGGSYVISISSNRYTFASRLVQVVDTLGDVDFVAN